MMQIIILIIIYLAFTSLGLPNSLLGSAWPVMQTELAVPLSGAGIISMLIYSGMMISSFFNGKLISRFVTEKIIFISMLTTAAALLGFWALPSFAWMCVAAIPLGLGCGTIDSTLNHFVAVHYKSSHMNWLHCFWGVGATIGPIIMSIFIAQNNAWRNGYFVVSMIQFGVAVVLLCTSALWKNVGRAVEPENPEKRQKDDVNPFHIPGVKIALVSFFFFCSLMGTIGLWGSSYLVAYKNVSADVAARWLSIFFIGITAGRFVSGFIAMKLKNSTLIRAGLIMAIMGAIVLLLPLPDIFSMIGLLITGLGCAPVLPCMTQETPIRFGKKAAQSVIGFQLAFAFMGNTFMPPVMGLAASKLSIGIFPFFVLAYILIIFISSETINKLLAKSQMNPYK